MSARTPQRHTQVGHAMPTFAQVAHWRMGTTCVYFPKASAQLRLSPASLRFRHAVLPLRPGGYSPFDRRETRATRPSRV